MFLTQGPRGEHPGRVLEQVGPVRRPRSSSSGSPRRPSRNPGRRLRGRRSDAAIVVVNNAQGEGMDRSTLAPAGRPGRADRGRGGRQPRTRSSCSTTAAPCSCRGCDRVDAVLQAWYPGQQFGAALAAVLFGDADPGGRLPVTFPASDRRARRRSPTRRATRASAATSATPRASSSATAGTTQAATGRCSRSATACRTRVPPERTCRCRAAPGCVVSVRVRNTSRRPARRSSSSTSGFPPRPASRPSSSRATAR